MWSKQAWEANVYIVNWANFFSFLFSNPPMQVFGKTNKLIFNQLLVTVGKDSLEILEISL